MVMNEWLEQQDSEDMAHFKKMLLTPLDFPKKVVIWCDEDISWPIRLGTPPIEVEIRHVGNNDWCNECRKNRKDKNEEISI